MEGKLMQAVLRKHDDQLRRVFGFYAGQDMSLDAQGAAGTVNCGEMAELCEDIGIFDSKARAAPLCKRGRGGYEGRGRRMRDRGIGGLGQGKADTGSGEGATGIGVVDRGGLVGAQGANHSVNWWQMGLGTAAGVCPTSLVPATTPGVGRAQGTEPGHTASERCRGPDPP
eukprot:440072-Prymnesium_polylepis.1